MKRFLDKISSARARLKENWKSRMNSTWRRMSRGAQYIDKIITFGVGDSWRRPKN